MPNSEFKTRFSNHVKIKINYTECNNSKNINNNNNKYNNNYYYNSDSNN